MPKRSPVILSEVSIICYTSSRDSYARVRIWFRPKRHVDKYFWNVSQRGMRLGAKEAKVLDVWPKAPMSVLRWEVKKACGYILQVDQKGQKAKEA